MTRCPACATDLREPARFCPECGTPLGEASRTPTRAARSSSGGAADHGRFLPGTIVASRYRIVEMLGRGGMGEVHRADDLKVGQSVALKFLPEAVERDAGRLARFLNEVRLARQVAHPNVCRVYDIGEADGRHFISMEYVDGEDLASLLLRIGRFPQERAVEIARQICAGLGAIHERGILHRDLKPGNVMIDGRGRVRITDFGLAGAAAGVPVDDLRAGTPAYMAPEQIEGREVTVRSDVYAMGHVLFELFTGRRAFDEGAGAGGSRESAVPARPSRHVEGIDPAVERAILRCLERDPRDRPASALAVAAALPGGDPLAAALAAGETPSPEVVAAAGQVGALGPAAAAAALAVGLAGFLAAAVLQGRATYFGIVAPPRSAEVLEERARDLLRALGHVEAPADSARGFEYDQGFIDFVEAGSPSASSWDGLGEERLAAVRFWYRQSPRHLVAQAVWPRVTPSDPPAGEPGMIEVRLDARGRLLSLEAAPVDPGAALEEPESGTPPPLPDWSRLLGEAGLDPARLEAIRPRSPRAAFGDVRAAWRGPHPDRADLLLEVEAAAIRGRPVLFETRGPWRPSAPAAVPPVDVDVNRAYMVGVFVAAYFAGALLARRNLRLGRGDRRGALRVAAYVFALRMLAWLAGASHAPSPVDEWSLFERGLGRALYSAALVGMLYLALEPYVRRRWPETLISWSRLLAGRFRDPLVGRDVLLGLAAAAPILGFGLVFPLLLRALGIEPPQPFPLPLAGLSDAGRFVADLMFVQIRSLIGSMVLLMLLLLAQVVLRKRWLALAASFMVFTPVAALAAGGRGQIFEMLLAAVSIAVIIATMARLGLLATTVCVSAVNLFVTVPMTTDPSAWYAGRALAAILIAAALAVYGFRVSLAGRPLIADRALAG
jgi:serine/threonine-protein kinase